VVSEIRKKEENMYTTKNTKKSKNIEYEHMDKDGGSYLIWKSLGENCPGTIPQGPPSFFFTRK
jgi:hypothetical protein